MKRKSKQVSIDSWCKKSTTVDLITKGDENDICQSDIDKAEDVMRI